MVVILLPRSLQGESNVSLLNMELGRKINAASLCKPKDPTYKNMSVKAPGCVIRFATKRSGK